MICGHGLGGGDAQEAQPGADDLGDGVDPVEPGRRLAPVPGRPPVAGPLALLGEDRVAVDLLQLRVVALELARQLHQVGGQPVRLTRRGGVGHEVGELGQAAQDGQLLGERQLRRQLRRERRPLGPQLSPRAG